MLTVYGFLQLLKAFFLSALMAGKKELSKTFSQPQILFYVRHYGHGTILLKHVTDKFKKNPALKWYITEKDLRHSISTRKTNACSVFMERNVATVVRHDFIVFLL